MGERRANSEGGMVLVNFRGSHEWAWVILTLFCLGIFVLPAWGQTGDPCDPFLIYDPCQMNAIGEHWYLWDKHFKLMADIDLSGYTGTDFNIIGSDEYNPFIGVFDGNGHTISNFTYSCTDKSMIGLFGYIGRFFGEAGEVKNLGLINPQIDATGTYIGTLAAVLDKGSISNCYVKGGTVSGIEVVGGLVGGFSADDGTMSNCYTTCNVIGERAAIGGIAGFITGIMSNCYASGNVTGEFAVGGLVGENWGAINNSYSAGKVVGRGSHIGGLVGDEHEGTVIDSFWDLETSGQTTSAGGTGKTTAEMQTESTFTSAGWDFLTPIWRLCEDWDYPYLDWQEYDPTLSIWDDEFFFFALEGGANPEVQTLYISNCGNQGTVNWGIEEVSSCAWLRVDPCGGSSSGEVAEVTLAADACDLAIGRYSCTLTIADPCAINSPVTAMVELYIFPEGGDIYVPMDYATLQEAIDAAAEGETIIAGPKVYNENIHFNGVNINLQSIDPCDEAITAQTVIHGGYVTSVVTFGGGEDPCCVLEGFTITAGYNTNKGGGIWGKGSRATVRKCVITANSAVDGAGVAESNGLIEECTISNNTASSDGGGIYGLNNDLTLSQCTIQANEADTGGGIYHEGGELILKNCVIEGNESNFGANMFCRSAAVAELINCIVSGGSAAFEGGGAYLNQGDYTLTNCTVCDNSATYVGGGVYINLSTYQLNNCILWNNSDMSGTSEAAQLTISSSGETGHNCIQGWTGSLDGIGNIGADPCFVDPCNGDYHLRSQGWRWDNNSGSWQQDTLTSRCIDAGNPGFALNNEPLAVPNDPCNLQGINKRINMGAYGGTPEASIPPHDWPMLADINNDGTTDLKDCTIQVADWLTTIPNKPGDLNRDGTINIHDFLLLTQDWLKQTSWYGQQ